MNEIFESSLTIEGLYNDTKDLDEFSLKIYMDEFRGKSYNWHKQRASELKNQIKF